MRKIRIISPLISVTLAILIVAGSSGFTLIKHSCYQCGMSEVFTPVELNSPEGKCCCAHNADKRSQGHSYEDFVIDKDCCSHEVERIITDETVRTEVQPEVSPYFTSSSFNYIISEQARHSKAPLVADDINSCGRKLNLLHCQLIS